MDRAIDDAAKGKLVGAIETVRTEVLAGVGVVPGAVDEVTIGSLRVVTRKLIRQLQIKVGNSLYGIVDSLAQGKLNR